MDPAGSVVPAVGVMLPVPEPPTMVKVRLAVPVPELLVALNATGKVPATVGVPRIKPVEVLIVKPPGSPDAP